MAGTDAGKFLLKYPPAALNSLLEAWQQCVASSEYHRQRARSDRRNESADVICQQRELKHRCHVLRSQSRRAVKLASTMGHGHHKADEAKRECDGRHLAPSAMSTFFVEHPCVPHVCVPLHCSWELLFALRSQNMAAGNDDNIDELTRPTWLGFLAGRFAGWLAGWLVS